MKGTLDTLRFIILQVENDFRLGVIDNTFSKSASIQIKKIIQVLRVMYNRDNTRNAVFYVGLTFFIDHEKGTICADILKKEP